MQTKLIMITLTALTLLACTTTNRHQEEDANDSPVESTVDSTKLAPTEKNGTLTLSHTTFIVEEGTSSADLRLYLRNGTEIEEVIDRVDPSCGCILTTIQSTIARPGDSAKIYVALLTEQMSRTQPYTVDVYLVSRPKAPLRLTIWHRSAYNLEFGGDK